MSIPVRLRRPLVVFGVLLALLLGATSIRAAAEWTAASSPLADKPPSVESLQAELATEQARSTALVDHLDELSSSSADLLAALGAARDRIAADALQAKDLQASLAAAKAKLAALEKSIRDARAGTGRSAATPAAAPAASTASHEDDHPDESEDD
jgi:chromosome segregation ATPase